MKRLWLSLTNISGNAGARTTPPQPSASIYTSIYTFSFLTTILLPFDIQHFTFQSSYLLLTLTYSIILITLHILNHTMTGRKRSEGRGYRPITQATLINTRDWKAFAEAASNDVMGNKVETAKIPIPTTAVDESQLTTAFNGQKITDQEESPMNYTRAAMNAKGNVLVSHAQASSHMSSQIDSQLLTVKHPTAAKTITAKSVKTCSGSFSRSSEWSQSAPPRNLSNNTSESLSSWGKGKTARQNKVKEPACRDIPTSRSFEKHRTSPASNDWFIWGNLNGPSAVGEDESLYW